MFICRYWYESIQCRWCARMVWLLGTSDATSIERDGRSNSKKTNRYFNVRHDNYLALRSGDPNEPNVIALECYRIQEKESTHTKEMVVLLLIYIYLLVKQAGYLVDCCHSLGHSYGSFVVWVVKGIHRRMMMNTDVLINGPTHGCVSTILCSVRLCIHCFGESMSGRWKCCDSDRTRYRHVYIRLSNTSIIQSAFIVSPDAYSSPCRVRPELQGDVFEALMQVQRLSKVPRQRDIVTVNGSLRVKASSRCWAYDDDPGPYHVHSTFSALNIDEQTERKSFLNQIALLEPDVYLNVLQGCRS